MAISEFTRAISFPQSPSTASAHHGLAVVLKKNGGEAHEINLHFEQSLDLGMDPTVSSLWRVYVRSNTNCAITRYLFNFCRTKLSLHSVKATCP